MKEFSLSQRNVVVPTDPIQREILNAVDHRTKSDIGIRFGLVIDTDWHANTIANTTMEAIIVALGNNLASGEAVGFNFYNLLTAYVTLKHNENAEKEGNINIAFEAASTALKLISGEGDTEEIVATRPEIFFGFPENPNLHAMYEKIDRQARYELNVKYGIVIPDKLKFGAFGVLYVFIENIFKSMLYTLANDQDKTLTSINFNDNIEFHAMRKKDGIIFSLRPGMNAKLLIKSDEMTEDESADDD